MPVYKRKYKSGEVVWSYLFSGPGGTREDRRQCTASGFKSKKEAQDAEALRRAEEQKRYEVAKAGAVTVAAALPKTLSDLLGEFFKQHADNLAPKTLARSSTSNRRDIVRCGFAGASRQAAKSQSETGL
jgi:hypothetical protein